MGWDNIDAQRYGYKAGIELLNQTGVSPKVVALPAIKTIFKNMATEYGVTRTKELESNFIKGFRQKGWGSR